MLLKFRHLRWCAWYVWRTGVQDAKRQNRVKLQRKRKLQREAERKLEDARKKAARDVVRQRMREAEARATELQRKLKRYETEGTD